MVKIPKEWLNGMERVRRQYGEDTETVRRRYGGGTETVQHSAALHIASLGFGELQEYKPLARTCTRLRESYYFHQCIIYIISHAGHVRVTANETMRMGDKITNVSKLHKI